MLPDCTLTLPRSSALALLEALRDALPLADETGPIHPVLLELVAALEKALDETALAGT